jgi:Na+/H+-translocating membrane pyrophosphatase
MNIAPYIVLGLLFGALLLWLTLGWLLDAVG